MKFLRNFFRILVGLLFIYSGFVKGVDPLGFGYKLEDYFIAFGTQWAIPLALTLSFLVNAMEFSIGVLLILKVRPKLMTLLALLITVFFFFLTLYNAIFNAVPDCGCFGDALILSNWMTFYKNVVLIVFIIFLYQQRKNFTSPWTTQTSLALMIVVYIGFAWFELYNYRNLPVVEFTAWKPGNHMIPENLLPANYYLVYQNKKTGETKEFLAKDLPWQDSVWMSEWVFKNQRIDDPNKYLAPNFKIIDTIGNDLTISYMKQPGYLLLLVSVNLTEVKEKRLLKLNDFYKKLYETGYTVIGLTGSTKEDMINLNRRYQLSIPWFSSDDTELKTMVRSNPGLVLMKGGVLVKKWHIRNLPDVEKFKAEYPLVDK
ncbi:MAG: DoxX family protein [Bacteroidetes bacterium]|nr:DoxX family protein [Bacteroidota bacterium]